MSLPADYAERVYAGVLGKLIGVYLGRPFEGWTYERIAAEFGEITYYVNRRRGVPLVVSDDDISGTFTFLRALPDYGCSADVSAAQIGQTWLNYIIERRTVLWWGGLGNSTEHTAYIRLKSGVSAPESGSMACNTRVVAEQIGAQIFIDGWGMVAPADPAFAADLARRAASVSHDGAAIHGAQVIAAMESQAFVEGDTNRLLDCGLSFIPHDSVLSRLIGDIRAWQAEDRDWRTTRARIDDRYGYHVYGGNCHIVPNHGLIILGLLYGDDDLQRTLTIVNTSGWDTDCNSGNVGCLLGIKNGLAGIESGPDWRGPIADRLYLPTADGGRAITDAVIETYHIVNIGRALTGEAPLWPKAGARFHFELPGSVQGFREEERAETQCRVMLENVEGHSRSGLRSLALRFYQLAPGQGARIATPTFIPPDAIAMPSYGLLASPTIYPGQNIRAALEADEVNTAPVTCRLFLQVYGPGDHVSPLHGPEVSLSPSDAEYVEWCVPDTGGHPIAGIGLELAATSRVDGSIYLDFLGWDGPPNTVFRRPSTGGAMWRRAWVDAIDYFEDCDSEGLRLIQNRGVGLLIQGTREWSEYSVSSALVPHMVRSFGLGAYVQGLERYYALLLDEGESARLVKMFDGETELARADFPWEVGRSYDLRLDLAGSRLRAWIGDELLFDLRDTDQPLSGGAVALICADGRVATDAVTIRPVGVSAERRDV